MVYLDWAFFRAIPLKNRPKFLKNGIFCSYPNLKNTCLLLERPERLHYFHAMGTNRAIRLPAVGHVLSPSPTKNYPMKMLASL
jgi:hypothetical protein